MTSGIRGRSGWLWLRSPDFVARSGLPLLGVLDDGCEIMPELFCDASPGSVVSNHRDMKRVDTRRSRQNRFPEYFFSDFQDFLLDRKDRDARQRLEAALSKAGITISRFIEHVLLIVSSGVGKTHLAIALGLAASGQGRKVRFFRVTELITLLMDAKEEKQLLRLRKQIKQLDLIVLDELGLRSDREGRGRAPL